MGSEIDYIKNSEKFQKILKFRIGQSNLEDALMNSWQSLDPNLHKRLGFE